MQFEINCTATNSDYSICYVFDYINNHLYSVHIVAIYCTLIKLTTRQIRMSRFSLNRDSKASLWSKIEFQIIYHSIIIMIFLLQYNVIMLSMVNTC